MESSGSAVLVALMIAAVAGSGSAAPARRMVRIPAGTYRPMYAAKSVAIPAFRLDKDPVTRGEYMAWKNPASAAIAGAPKPMTGVRRSEASAFCSAQGGRLPTLAEWEYVAAASDSRDLIAVYSMRSANPAAVGRGVTNSLGVRGMHDLVWEWVADPNEHIAARHDGHGQPHDVSCAGAAIGAADLRDYPAFLRAATRSGLTETTRMPTLGFRCAA